MARFRAREIQEAVKHHTINIMFGEVLLNEASVTTKQLFVFYPMNYGHPDNRQPDYWDESEPEIVGVYVEGNDEEKHEILEKLIVAEFEKGNKRLDLSQFITLN